MNGDFKRHNDKIPALQQHDSQNILGIMNIQLTIL